jgi:uncharacterized protein YacL
MMTAETPTRRRGRPVLGAIFGLLFGVLLTFDLLMMGTFRLDSILVPVIPVLLLAAGLALGWTAPLRFLRR